MLWQELAAPTEEQEKNPEICGRHEENFDL